MVELNTPVDAKYIDTDEAVSLSDYWNGSKFVSIGEPPSPHHTFDYSIKQWIDPRTLDEIKDQKWTEIKSGRDQLEFGGFEFEGGIYDSDMKSQGRISAAASLGAPVEWTLQDNSTIWLSSADLQGLVQALAQHVTSVHERGRVARQLIYDAETIEQVEAVTL